MLLVFAILFGNDRSHWGDVWGGSGDYLFGGHRRDYSTRKKTDFELRLEARKHSEEQVVMVSADDYIAKPDFELDRMIADSRIDEAREYRAQMEDIADEMEDDKGLRKYAIYGARIARKAKEIAQEKRKKMLEAPMQLPGESKDSGFLTPVAGTSSTAGVVGTTRTPSIISSTAPPLWKVKKSTDPTTESKALKPERREFIPPKPPADKVKKTEPEKVEQVKKLEEKKPKKRLDYYKPSAPSKDKPKFIRPQPAPEPEKPVIKPEHAIIPEPPLKPTEPVTLPKDFTPPPSGPVTLGTPGPTKMGEGREGYTSGPVDLDAKLKKKEEELEKSRKKVKEKIDPDDYGDLISL